MTYSSEVLADSPLLYWRLGETSGTTAADSSGNGRTGTYTGAPTLGVTGLLTGDADKAVTTVTTGDYVTGAAPATTSAFTIEVWVKNITSDGFLATRYPSTTSQRLFVLQVSGGKASANVRNNAGSVNAFNGTTTLGTGTRHIVLTYDGSASRIYVDGVLDATDTTITGALGSGTPNLEIGARTAGPSYRAGTYDEVALYNTALSGARILAHYNAGITPATDQVRAAATMPSMTGGLSLDAAQVAHLNATMPAMVGALDIDLGRIARADAQMPPMTGSVVLDNGEFASLRVAGSMPAMTAEIALGRPVEPEANRAGAWIRDNVGEARWTPPVELPTAAVEPVQQVAAQSYPSPSFVGTRVVVDPTYTRDVGYRDRIVIAGRDVTYFRGAPTPTPDWQLVQPLLWGAATIELPQVAVPFEQPGHGALSWLKPGASVLLQRVDTATDEIIAAQDYRGIIIGFGINGNRLFVECGGHSTGRAALRDRQMRLIQQRVDAGTLCVRAMKQIGVRHDPPLRQATGVELIDWGGGGMLDYVNELVGKMATVDGNQYTVMPDEDAVYRTTLKDLETIHGTVYLDGSRVKGDLRRDIAEEPNRIFASGVTPNGMVVKFGAYPGLIQAPAPDYPFDDNSTFGVGTTDGDTDTGDGITIMGWRLFTAGYLEGQTSYSTFTSAMATAIRALRRDAGLANTGDMNLAAWRALFDLSVTGYDLRNIRILPAAEDAEVKAWRLSASGGLIARNPSFDPSVIWVDRTIAMGSGFTRSQIRQWARLALHDGEVWRGTIELNLGAIVAGDHTPGDPVTEILRDRDIQPGMNLSLPLFAGGIVVHVAGVSYTNGGKTTTLAVSTQPGDTLPIWAAIQRDRESRDTVHRSFFRNRRSADLERENTYDEVGGVIQPIALEGGKWTVFPVVAKQAGTIEKIHMQLSPMREFVVAVFGRRISRGRLAQVTNAPLSPSGRARWTEEAVYDALNRDHVVLYVAGSDEEPCGYFPGTKTEGESLLTGRWEDDASFPFVTFSNDTDRGSVLWVAVWTASNSTLQGGRIMWPSAEEY